MKEKFLNILLVLFFIATFITKTVEEPFLITLSPADLLWPLIAMVFLYTLYKDQTFRKDTIHSKPVWFVIGLFVIGIIASIHGYLTLMPTDITKLNYGKSLLISNIKNFLIVGYFLGGVLLSKKLDSKTFIILGVISTTTFSLVGIFSFITGFPEWALGDKRLISTVNDPNVAGLVCLIGLLFCWQFSEIHFDHRWIKFTSLTTCILLLTTTLFLTGSRTGFLCVFIIFIFFILRNMRKWKVLLLCFTILLLMISALYQIDRNYFYGENYSYLVGRIFNGTETAVDFRSTLRQSAYSMGKDHLIFGVGPGQFPNFSTPYYEKLGIDVTTTYFETTISPKVPHNTYVTFFAERGIIGIVLFIVFWVSIILSQRNIFRVFIFIVGIYSFFFNIENIRILWLLWGMFSALHLNLKSTNVPSPNTQNTNMKYSFKKKFFFTNLGIIFIFFISVTIFYKNVSSMSRPFAYLIGQTIEIIVENNELELILEFSGDANEPLFISFDGEIHEEIILHNHYGFYKDRIQLPSGIYTMSLSSGRGQKKILQGSLVSGENSIYIYPSLINGNLSTKCLDDIDFRKMQRVDIPINYNRLYRITEYTKTYALLLNQVDGINFEDKIQLEDIRLNALEEPNQYEMIFEFKKIGQIENPFIFLIRGYDLRDTRKGHSKNLSKNIDFDPLLTDIEIGETFIATWTFNTEAQPYMLNYGFYYENPESGEVIQPYPKWVLDGYVQ